MQLGRLSAVFACLMLAGALLAHPVSGEAPHVTQGQIQAAYEVGVANIDLGTVDVAAKFGGTGYDLTANGEFSLLAGLLYRATGKTTSNGKLAGAGPQPERYSLSVTDNQSNQRVQIAFAGNTVRDVQMKPKKRPDKKAVPIPEGQLSNVLDPLTAAFMSVRSNIPPGDLEICNQTLRVFDGRQRFDLTLSPKRTEAIAGQAPKAVAETVAVCRVKYEPVGGYRRENSAVQFLQKSDEIEAWLVAVPGTGFYVPYKVVVPTAWGDGAIVLTGLNADTGATRRASMP